LTPGRKGASSEHKEEWELVLDTRKKRSWFLTPGRKGVGFDTRKKRSYFLTSGRKGASSCTMLVLELVER
jgi:hypothetical protein